MIMKARLVSSANWHGQILPYLLVREEVQHPCSKQLQSMLPHNVETCQASQIGTGRICYAISQYQSQTTTMKARFVSFTNWHGKDYSHAHYSDEGQCSKCSHCFSMVRFVKLQKLAQVEVPCQLVSKTPLKNTTSPYNEGKICQFHKLAWEGNDTYEQGQNPSETRQELYALMSKHHE